MIWFSVTDRPNAEWVSQKARNVSWEQNQLGVPVRFLIHDHDLKYGGGADLVFESEGIRVIKTPIRAPKRTHIWSAKSARPGVKPRLDSDSQSATPRARPQ